MFTIVGWIPFSGDSLMHGSIAAFALLLSAGLLAAQQDTAGPSKAPAAAASSQAPIRFDPEPTIIAGLSLSTHAVAVSADGERIATCGYSTVPAASFVSVIETKSKKQLLLMRLPRQAAAVSISADGKLVAFTDGSWGMRVVEIDTGKTVYTKLLDGSSDVAFAASGKSFATLTAGKTIQVWDLASGHEQARVNVGTRPLPHSINFSADGKRLAALLIGAGGISVWDVATTRLVSKLKLDKVAAGVTVMLSPDGALAADIERGGGARGRLIRIWDVAGAKLQTELRSPETSSRVAFAPDGRTMVSGMNDGAFRFWDTSSGEEIDASNATPARRRGLVNDDLAHPCNCFAFLDGGKKIVWGSKLRSLRLWDVAAKKDIATLIPDERSDDMTVPVAMSVTSDGSLVALATEERGVVLRDGRTGEMKATLTGHDDSITCVAFSPDNKMLATGSADKTIKLWDLSTLKERATLKGHTNWVYALAFSHDGKSIGSGAYDRTVRLWDVQTGNALGTIDAHRGSVRALAFSPDGTAIASGGSDHFVKVWALPSRDLKFEVNEHQGAVRTLAFSTNGKALASGDEDGLVKLYDPATGKPLAITKKKHNGEVTAVAFADDRLLLSGGADGAIRQWDVATGQMIGVLPGHDGGVRGVAVAGGKQFFSTGMDHALKRFRRAAPGPVRLFVGHTGTVQSASFSPDGQRFVSCGRWPEGDKTLRIWDVIQGTEVLKIVQPDQVERAQYSPDGKLIVSASADSNAYLWDATTGKLVRTFKGHTAGLHGAVFNGDGSRLLTCGEDKTARIWETATGREIQKFTCPESIHRALFHPDGKHALSASQDGFARMWELDTAREVKRFKSPDQLAEVLAVSKDGKYLATGRGPFCAYEIDSGQKFPECIGHQFAGRTNNEFTDDGIRLYKGGLAGATNIVFTNDGKRILSGGFDHTARLWERETGKELYRFEDNREYVLCVAVSPDGKWILTGGGGGSTIGQPVARGPLAKGDKVNDTAIRLWKIPDENAIAEYLQGD